MLQSEERFGISSQSGSLPLAVQEKLLCAPYLDPPDERAGKTLRPTVYPLQDRSQTSGNFPVTSRHYLYWQRSTPNSRCRSTSVLPLSNPRFAVAFLRPARARWRYSQDG